MAEKRVPLGYTGEAVRGNISRIRENQRLSYAELSRKLDELGRPIATLGLARIEKGERRVDVDDLVALAIALGVSPATLLMPRTDGPAEWLTSRFALTGSGQKYPAEVVWEWLTANAPLSEQQSAREIEAFRLSAIPADAYMRRQLGFDADGRMRRSGDD